MIIFPLCGFFFLVNIISKQPIWINPQVLFPILISSGHQWEKEAKKRKKRDTVLPSVCGSIILLMSLSWKPLLFTDFLISSTRKKEEMPWIHYWIHSTKGEKWKNTKSSQNVNKTVVLAPAAPVDIPQSTPPSGSGCLLPPDWYSWCCPKHFRLQGPETTPVPMLLVTLVNVRSEVRVHGWNPS